MIIIETVPPLEEIILEFSSLKKYYTLKKKQFLSMSNYFLSIHVSEIISNGIFVLCARCPLQKVLLKNMESQINIS